jgi:hypothetical protein
MAHAFAPISAKPTFGTLKENLYQSDYINRIKGKNIYCNNVNRCNKFINSNSYDKLYSFNLGRYAVGLEKNSVLPVNKTNLVIGQYTKLNLDNVCTVANGPPPTDYCSYENPCNPCQNNTSVIIDTSTTSLPFYWGKTIDPLGELFGSSQCGELNYTKYMVLNLPIAPLTLNTS